MSIDTVELFDDFSLEMTGKDAPALPSAVPFLPAGTRVNVTFLGNEDAHIRCAAAKTVRAAGLVPVPHLSARRITSEAELEQFLGMLAAVGSAEHLFAIAGDPARPEGPFESALDLIRSPALAGGDKSGVPRVGIAGYPEGHPQISRDRLWRALEGKVALLEHEERAGDIITQFGFDADPVLEWIAEVRARGIRLPVRVGVPGPASVKRLLGYAARFGVASTTGIARKYGLSLTNLLGTAGPATFIESLAEGLDPTQHGTVRLHFYTFGGLEPTARWISSYLERA